LRKKWFGIKVPRGNPRERVVSGQRKKGGGRQGRAEKGGLGRGCEKRQSRWRPTGPRGPGLRRGGKQEGKAEGPLGGPPGLGTKPATPIPFRFFCTTTGSEVIGETQHKHPSFYGTNFWDPIRFIQRALTSGGQLADPRARLPVRPPGGRPKGGAVRRGRIRFTVTGPKRQGPGPCRSGQAPRPLHCSVPAGFALPCARPLVLAFSLPRATWAVAGGGLVFLRAKITRERQFGAVGTGCRCRAARRNTRRFRSNWVGIRDTQKQGKKVNPGPGGDGGDQKWAEQGGPPKVGPGKKTGGNAKLGTRKKNEPKGSRLDSQGTAGWFCGGGKSILGPPRGAGAFGKTQPGRVLPYRSAWMGRVNFLLTQGPVAAEGQQNDCGPNITTALVQTRGGVSRAPQAMATWVITG